VIHAETPDEWVALGARVHGGFGGFIPLGIRIGLDALDRLHAMALGEIPVPFPLSVDTVEKGF
jgi:hypothetical protein